MMDRKAVSTLMWPVQGVIVMSLSRLVRERVGGEVSGGGGSEWGEASGG